MADLRDNEREPQALPCDHFAHTRSRYPTTIKPPGSTVMLLAENPKKASAWHEIGRLLISMNVSTRLAPGAIG